MSWGIPNPTGPHLVACVDILDRYGIDSTTFRIYYPTDKFEPNDDACPLWMDNDYLEGFTGLMGGGIWSKLLNWYFKSRRIPVRENGPLVLPENVSKLPIVLFSHGLMMCKNAYSYISYEIASYGFIVAAVDHKDGSACSSLFMENIEGETVKKFLRLESVQKGPEGVEARNTQVEKRTKDISKLMDCVEMLNDGTLNNLLLPSFDLTQFKGKIDIEKCAVTGHSYGGATAVTSLLSDDRIKVGVGLDAWTVILEEKYFKLKVEKPLVFINAVGEVKKEDITKMRLLDCDVTDVDTERQMVTMLNTTHATQSDFAFFPKTKWFAKLMTRGSVDPKLANHINRDLMLGFMRKHLNLPLAVEVDDILKQHPDILIKGTDVKITEAEIEDAKARIKSQP